MTDPAPSQPPHPIAPGHSRLPIMAFDLGKVLLDFDYQVVIRRLIPHCRHDAASVLQTLTQSPRLLEFESGRIRTDEFLEALREATGYRAPRPQFESDFCDIFTPIEPMVRLHACLRRHGYPTWIFSNTNELQSDFIRNQYPFFHQFDGWILSYQQGVMKPHPAIYEALEKATGRSGADIVYLDDRPENIAEAARRGWRALVHRQIRETMLWLRGQGIDPACLDIPD